MLLPERSAAMSQSPISPPVPRFGAPGIARGPARIVVLLAWAAMMALVLAPRGYFVSAAAPGVIALP